MLFWERNNKHYQSNNNNNCRNIQKINNNRQVHLSTRTNIQHQVQHAQENDGDVSSMEIDNINRKKNYVTLSNAEKQRKDPYLCAYSGGPADD